MQGKISDHQRIIYEIQIKIPTNTDDYDVENNTYNNRYSDLGRIFFHVFLLLFGQSIHQHILLQTLLL